MITLSEAKAIYKTGGGHFFDRETFKYWGSRIESALYKTAVLLPVKTILTAAAELTPCAVSLLTFLHVETVGEFQEHATKWGAREAAKEVV